MISIDPVAYFHADFDEKADLPRQGSLETDYFGVIRFLPGKNFEQALEDLKGMEKIWVLFWMHQVHHWKVKVQPPREVKKKGVFATRSPHRPNPIGLSCVTLVEVRGLDLVIKDHDFLDGTPVLDIKPYLAYADSFPDAKSGWMDDLPPLPSLIVHWKDFSLEQISYLKSECEIDLRFKVEARLKRFIAPSSSNRISFLGEKYYLQAYKDWRILFEKKDEDVFIIAVLSGYTDPRIEDHPLHKKFLEKFQSFFSEKHLGKGWFFLNHFNDSMR